MKSEPEDSRFIPHQHLYPILLESKVGPTSKRILKHFLKEFTSSDLDLHQFLENGHAILISKSQDPLEREWLGCPFSSRDNNPILSGAKK
ncbi:hypothetical protein PoB_006627700 [Plakobranchus ocellatus]|uniref:Uncharacterized protein n=1 Tax=Plakobranchus ocellatus TaxID=259542 RepID=A0AAV4D6N6_9GAST|nr:hypothetical protein PoB_006627700 [Plakobranchus ocellatus]